MRKLYLFILPLLVIFYSCKTPENAQPVEEKPVEPANIEQARPVAEYLDSLGVATHIGFARLPYNQNFDEIIKPRLQELGIKHIRTDLSGQKFYFQHMKELGAMGIKANVVTRPQTGMTLDALMKNLKTLGDMAISVEGPNEQDGSQNTGKGKPIYQGKFYPEGLELFQNKLYETINSDSETQDIKVVAPSFFTKNITEAYSMLGKLKCDLNNIHSYPAGRGMTTRGLDTMGGALNNALEFCGEDKPIIATETGYHNAIYVRGKNHNDEKSAGTGVSEAAAGKYINRLFLNYFNRNIERTYIYELIDKNPDPSLSETKNHWGLLRNDGSRKPSFIALRNAIAILSEDNTTSTEPINNKLGFNLSGNTANVRHTLLQKQDGRFYLALWQEVDSYDRVRLQDIAVEPVNLQLFIDEDVREVNFYDPLQQRNAIKQVTGENSLEVAVSDRPIFLEIVIDN
ncbi:hypothetical protein [Myxosarcina sp. GI1]|uniref:hypothetical protein n=1 Tax=Myxosarcina sp. GI1 TaxID=1541065 RepID=UPI00056D5D05|nr:hypothetical protein [Myxosarcina sp. GI1]